jgi:ABC-type transport system involved in multi-copper enzyme maturation permease subunit
MVLETQILPFLEWLTNGTPVFLVVIAVLVCGGLFVSYLLSAAGHGPGRAVGNVLRSIKTAWVDLINLSGRRVVAMARLAVKESLRRYVLVVFVVFGVILLFAGWYLDVKSDNPGRLYLSFVLKATNFLVILLAIFLSSFSLPNDIKNKTIYTVVTKPVRAWEIILGRILGFVAIGTAILMMMCLFSYVFVRRGLNHQHRADISSLQPTDDNPSIQQGETSFDNQHRHDFTVGGKSDATDARMGHSHWVNQREDGTLEIGRPEGALEARVPIYGKLRFLDRQGRPTRQGINVGKEWFYRGYVEGRTLSAGIWRFENLKSRDYLEELPIEMAIRVFRTHKGEIEKGILGNLRFLNGDPEVQRAALAANPDERRLFDPDTAVESDPIFFEAQEFTPESLDIPRKIPAIMLDGSRREVDLFEAFAQKGALEIKIMCDEPAQYYGMAQADLYIRAADNMFWWNFVKSYITMWLQMLVVTAFGVMFSTFLAGSVAMLATIFAIVMGYFSHSIMRVATGEQEGGGPLESIVRIVRQDNLVSDLDAGASTIFIQAFDVVAMAVLQAVSVIMPNFRDYAEHGGINTARFVAYGFDIPSSLMWQQVVISFLYVAIVSCAAYFLFKSKEIAG